MSMKKKRKHANKSRGMKKESLAGLAIVIVFIGVIAYFFISSEAPKGEIPAYVTGETRQLYEWAKTPDGAMLLEQVPCYCGCKYEGHLHARHCFWRDDGTFDKHGITCSTCLDIAKKSIAMLEQGNNTCQIRNSIDKFYEPNAELATSTPMPEGCTGLT